MNNPQTSMPSAQASPEAALGRYLTQIERRREGLRAVHIHISALRKGNRQPHHMRIAADTFESLAKAFDGQVFSLSNGDLVAFCKNAALEQIDAAVLRVRQLFSDDPLAVSDDEDRAQFCSWYDLETQYPGLKEQVGALISAQKQRTASGAQAATTRLRPLTPKLLGGLEVALSQADISNIMRRQAIYALAGDAEPQRILHEVYVSIGDLRQTLAPKIDLLSDTWLFRRLTETLDRRMMSLMCRMDDSTISSYFSLNLNVSTLLSPEFLQFDAALRAGARGTVVIELQLIDIYSDMGSYLFARDFAKDRGYRICLDGLTYLNAPFFDRKALGLDLIKLQWSRDVLDDPTGARQTALKEMVANAGGARVIMCHCDDAKAVTFGQELGIGMFQGRELDKRCGASTGSQSISQIQAKAEAGAKG